MYSAVLEKVYKGFTLQIQWDNAQFFQMNVKQLIFTAYKSLNLSHIQSLLRAHVWTGPAFQKSR